VITIVIDCHQQPQYFHRKYTRHHLSTKTMQFLPFHPVVRSYEILCCITLINKLCNKQLPLQGNSFFYLFSHIFIVDQLNKKNPLVLGIRKFINICLLTIELNLVWITPGQILLTLIPLGPNSCASTLVNPNKAVLLTEYGPRTYV